MSGARRTPLRYSANAVIRKEAELMNLSPEFSVAFFTDMMNRVLSSAMVNGTCWVPGIGSFKRTEYKARNRHNPRTGKIELIPGGEKITFHPSKPRRAKAPAPDTIEAPTAPSAPVTRAAKVHKCK